MAMSFTWLRTFHAVAAHRGFTAAARALGIGQPTVTTQIKEFETAYGVELLERSGRRVELTDAGTALFAITKRLMSLRDEADELLGAHRSLHAGHLRLAAVGPFHATEILAAFKRDFPRISVSVVLGNSERTLKHVLDLEADVAILAHSVDDPRVHAAPYREHRVIAFVNRQHPWFRRRSVSLAELASQPLVLREQGSTTRRALEQALACGGFKVQPVFEIGSREGVWKAVEQGLGISVVADFEFVPHPNLRALEINDAEIRTEYRIVCLRERAASPKISAFMKVAEKLRSPYLAGQGTFSAPRSVA
jgi:LysR family transcriptional regulator, low CO2-responsive transcriptional regulator